MKTAESLRSRIAVLQSRNRDNGAIVRKLLRKLRKLGSVNP